MVNGLIFFSELFNYAAFWVRGLAGRTTLSELQRALQMSLLCSVKLQRRKDGPLTTDSCQWDGTLALTRPMSSNGGDKCLANQLAYKITALPSAAHTSTWSDSMHSLQLSCSQSCVCLSLSLTHPSVISTVTKALVNTICRNKNKSRERNPCSKMTQKETQWHTNLFRAILHWDWIISMSIIHKEKHVLDVKRQNDPSFLHPSSCLSPFQPPGGNLGLEPHRGSWNSEL